MDLVNALDYSAMVLSGLAAILGLRAATIAVRNNMDEFIHDLHRQGRWTSWAALVNAVAVIVLVATQILRH